MHSLQGHFKPVGRIKCAAVQLARRFSWKAQPRDIRDRTTPARVWIIKLTRSVNDPTGQRQDCTAQHYCHRVQAKSRRSRHEINSAYRHAQESVSWAAKSARIKRSTNRVKAKTLPGHVKNLLNQLWDNQELSMLGWQEIQKIEEWYFNSSIAD
jgi:hypothetical protein